jgi:hypothetical protein
VSMRLKVSRSPVMLRTVICPGHSDIFLYAQFPPEKIHQVPESFAWYYGTTSGCQATFTAIINNSLNNPCYIPSQLSTICCICQMRSW